MKIRLKEDNQQKLNSKKVCDVLVRKVSELDISCNQEVFPIYLCSSPEHAMTIQKTIIA